MCTVAAALSVVSGVAGYAQDSMNYSAAAAGHNQTVKNTQQELVNSYAHSQHRIRQERTAATEKKIEAQIEGMRSGGQQAVASGEAGVSGNTPLALLGSSYAAMGRYTANVGENYSMQRDNLRAGMDQEEKRAKSVMTNSYNSLPPKPSPLSIVAGLQV